MGFFDTLGAAVRRKFHEREIRQSLERFERHTGASASTKQTFSDSGSFRSQVDRLFTLGNARETGALRSIAESVVGATLSNRYYRAADFLSDVLEDLERTTFLTGESNGEPALSSCPSGREREIKIAAIVRAWLVPAKVASIESAAATHAEVIGRELPYRALDRFERNVARLVSLLETSELHFTDERVRALLARWRTDQGFRERFDTPAAAVAHVLAMLHGEAMPQGVGELRARRADQPKRLSTIVPEDRQHWLSSAFAAWDRSATP